MKTTNIVLVAGVIALAGSPVAVADDDATQVLALKKSERPLAQMESLPVSCHAVEAGEGRAPSLLPDGKRFKLVWRDEFDGTALDASKWSYRTNFWGRRASWFAAPEDGAVEVKDGCARLKIVRRADGSFCSPQLQTGGLVWDDMIDQSTAAKGSGIKWPFPKREKAKFLHRFGYWECRCRLQEKPGWWSAFWMQSPDQGATIDPRRSGIEQDIMESFVPGRYIIHAFHYNGYGADYKRFNAQRAPYTPVPEGGAFELSYPAALGEFHTFGLLWEPDGYTVFVDGKQSGYKVGNEGDEAVSHAEEFVLISTEIKGFRKDNKPEPEALQAFEAGDAFVVDFVRVYDVVR